MACSKLVPDWLSSDSRGREHCISGGDLWRWWIAAKQQAIAADIPLAEIDWLLLELTDLDRLAIRLESFRDQPAIALKIPFIHLCDRWQQRIETRMPLQYLTGVAPWRQFRLQVSPAVLIPRPETECLIDYAIAAVAATGSAGEWADLGTGSGAIAIALATELPDATIHAVDCSLEALAIAQMNAQMYHLKHRIRFYHGSWFEPLQALQGELRGIVSNPPYIPTDLLSDLQPEVVGHEPHLALDGGVDGLDYIRHLVATAPTYLRPGGILLFETMAGQAIAVTDLLQQQGRYCQIQIHSDLAGIERFALATIGSKEN